MIEIIQINKQYSENYDLPRLYNINLNGFSAIKDLSSYALGGIYSDSYDTEACFSL